MALLLFLGAAGAACGRPGASDGETTPTPNLDEAIFGEMLEGGIDPEEGLSEISMRGGWPIATESGYVFVRLDDGNGPWSLAGDHDGWAGTPMEQVPGFYWVRIHIGSPAGKKYKFVDARDAYEADAWSRRYGYDENGEYSLVDATGAHLERFFAVGDAAIAPRTIRVRVPSAPPTHHLYVHDGQNLFDPGAPFGGWELDESLGPSTLAVGIDNSPDRMDEYTHVADDIGGGPVGGNGDAYADFVHETVRPMIEARFGTPEVAGTMGSSLGGLISFHIAQRHAGEYDFAASLSGTMGWGSIGANNETMIERWVAAGHGSTKLYLDSGGDDGGGCTDADADGVDDDTQGAEDNYCENRQFADELAAAGYTYDVDLWHWHEPGATHDEAAWAARVFRPVGIFESL